MSSPNPFTPGESVVAATSTSSAATALPKGGNQVRLLAVGGSDIVYFRFGDSAQTVSATNGVRLMPGVVEIFTKPQAATHIALIASANTPGVYITCGEGTT